MTNSIIVAGAGSGGKSGGGGAPRAAVEAPNSLRSKQIGHIIDLLGEGEWEGLVDGPAGIYLNGVQLFTPAAPTGDVLVVDEADSEGAWPYAGTWNFQGVTVEFRHGTQGQSAIRTASTVSSAQSVGVLVTRETPVTAAITDTNFDVAVVNVQVNALYQQNTQNGDISGYYVDLMIDVQPDGGWWQTAKVDRIEGKAMSPYVRSYSIPLTAIGDGPWNVRVVRVSDNDSSSAFHSEIVFLGLSLVSRDKFRYPNSVLCSLGIDASQFSSIPSRAYDCKMTRVRVPSNYNPVTRAYDGVWDGTFVIAWTDNPAWCLYEMATNPRFGLGEYFDEDVFNKWSLYQIAQYCDELVPNGFGGMEPRFTINAYFQQAEEAISLLQHMASIFRGIVYYMANELHAVQDAPSDPVYAFNTTNVVDGRFNYTGAAGSARHTVAMVVWNNPEIDYKQDIEYVEDPEGLVKFGYRPVTITAIGCTSRGQAHRLGLWSLFVEQNESDIVSFSTALEGTGITPGVIVEIYDPTRAGIRLGGRIIEKTGSVVGLDQAITLPAGTHTVTYIGDDGALLSRTTTVTGGSYSTISLDGSDPMPSIGSLFGISTSTVLPQLFRVVSIVEQGKNYEISAIAHNPSKYGYVEQGLTLQQRPTSATNLVRPAPTNVQFHEALYLLGDESVGIRLSVSWDQDQLAMGYMVSWRKGSENWSTEKLIMSNELTINPVSEGWNYAFRITPVSLLGKKGVSTEVAHLVIGEKVPPPPFDYFTCIVQPDGTRQFDFGYTTTEKPVDFKGARIRYIHGASTNWDEMTPLENEGFFPFSPIETNQLFSGSYTIAACAEDRTKNLSTPVFISVTIPDRRLGNVLAEFNEKEDGWPGTLTNCHVALDIIEANDSTTWDTLPSTWDAWTRWNTSPASPITYETATRDLVSIVAGLLDVSLNADGTSVVEVATSNDGLTWSSWMAATAPFTARYFKLRVQVTATVENPVPAINSLRYLVGGKVKKESLNDVNVGALTGPYRIGTGDIRVPISNTYSVISRVTIMAIQDSDPGWTWLLVDRDVSVGPRLRFYRNGVLSDPDLVDVYIEGY